MSNPFKSLNNREQGSERPSQASRITDSAQVTDVNQNERLKKIKDQPKQKSAKSAAKSNIDAESANDANKPLTRARAKIIASQYSQSNENNSLATRAEIVSQSHAPSGSSLIIKRIKD